MNLTKVDQILTQIFPAKYAESWDNVGWMVYPSNLDLKGIQVCVDPSPEALTNALSRNLNLIVSHHPLLFESLDRVRYDQPVESVVTRAIKNDVAIFTAHTNADSMPRGLNDRLAKILNLNDTEPIDPLETDKDAGLGRIGVLNDAKTVSSLVDLLRKKLQLNFVQLLGSRDQTVREVGICSGSGGDFIGPELASTIDLYITSDVKHHEADLARTLDLTLVNLDHYEMESVFLSLGEDKLRKKFDDVAIKTFRREDPYDYMFTS